MHLFGYFANKLSDDKLHKFQEARENDTEAAYSCEYSQNLASTKASMAQGHGFGNLFANQSVYYPGCDQIVNVTPPASPNCSQMALAPTPARVLELSTSSSIPTMSPSKVALARRTVIIDSQHDDYANAPVLPIDQLGKFDLVDYWNVSSLSIQYPTHCF